MQSCDCGYLVVSCSFYSFNRQSIACHYMAQNTIKLSYTSLYFNLKVESSHIQRNKSVELK